MSQLIYQVDSFAESPFRGNPAAVCILLAAQRDGWMQNLAGEMNLSETAFLVERTDGDGYDLRWFTPAVEVDLCGHATLASAHILWEAGHLDRGSPARFHTKSGPLTCQLRDAMIEMDFPAQPPHPCSPPDGMMEALGVEATHVGANGWDHLFIVESERQVHQVEPDFGRLGELSTRGVMVSARTASQEYDFVSRFFAPAAGIDEDPVTGSAHCCLGPYWGKVLGKDSLVGYQASKRGGAVHITLKGERVLLAGRAVTVMCGELQGAANPKVT